MHGKTVSCINMQNGCTITATNQVFFHNRSTENLKFEDGYNCYNYDLILIINNTKQEIKHIITYKIRQNS